MNSRKLFLTQNPIKFRSVLPDIPVKDFVKQKIQIDEKSDLGSELGIALEDFIENFMIYVQ
jgi:hypothetical protein